MWSQSCEIGKKPTALLSRPSAAVLQSWSLTAPSCVTRLREALYRVGDCFTSLVRHENTLMLILLPENWLQHLSMHEQELAHGVVPHSLHRQTSCCLTRNSILSKIYWEANDHCKLKTHSCKHFCNCLVLATESSVPYWFWGGNMQVWSSACQSISAELVL